nr:hypothetical protein [Pandoravirus aubagnensis]
MIRASSPAPSPLSRPWPLWCLPTRPCFNWRVTRRASAHRPSLSTRKRLGAYVVRPFYSRQSCFAPYPFPNGGIINVTFSPQSLFFCAHWLFFLFICKKALAARSISPPPFLGLGFGTRALCGDSKKKEQAHTHGRAAKKSKAAHFYSLSHPWAAPPTGTQRRRKSKNKARGFSHRAGKRAGRADAFFGAARHATRTNVPTPLETGQSRRR